MSKRHGRRRYYGCDYHTKRGGHICQNPILIRQEALDQAVLAAIHEVLDERILAQAVGRTWSGSGPRRRATGTAAPVLSASWRPSRPAWPT